MTTGSGGDHIKKKKAPERVPYPSTEGNWGSEGKREEKREGPEGNHTREKKKGCRKKIVGKACP